MNSPGRRLHIVHLQSGGIITNYYCTSRCRHCLYACSPDWEKKYIDEETVRQNLRTIKTLGCSSIHLGGGEPFLDVEGLAKVLAVAREEEVNIEYVETNSSWYRDRDSAADTFAALKKAGLSSVLVSISPFHNEHIPFYKVKGTIEACKIAGISAVLWISDFCREIDSFDDRVTHPLSEYAARFGGDYLRTIPFRYWIHLGGRALETFKDVFDMKSTDFLLASNRHGCSELQEVGHFHLDLFGNYIPGMCSGLAIRREDLGKEITPERYPIISTLFASGINAFLRIASETYGFKPRDLYLSKCHLCVDIRRFLVREKHIASLELQPESHYSNLT